MSSPNICEYCGEYEHDCKCLAAKRIATLELQLSALEAKCAEMSGALEKAQQWIDVDSSGEGCTCNVSEHCSYCSKATSVSRKIAHALSSTCGQHYIHKDKVRKLLQVIEPMNCYCFGKCPIQIQQGYICERCEALQLAKAEGLIE